MNSVKTKRNRKKLTAGQIMSHIIIVCLLIMVLFPFYILVINSFKSPADILKDPLSFPGAGGAQVVTGAFKAAWPYISKYILNTFLVAFLEVFGVLLFASLAAYGFSRFKFKGKDTLFMLFLAFMMIPGILTLATQYSLVYSTLNLKQTYAGVVLPAIAGGMPINIFLMKTFFDGIPTDIYEAAEMDGASKLGCYFRVAIPLSTPILFTVGLSTLLGAWNDVVWARLILYGAEDLYTIGVGVFTVFGSSAAKIPDTVIYAGYCLASLPLLIAFFFTSKQFIKGLTDGAIKM
ncbi:MAG: carbohydrate ABC transporter permease [Eubacteriales bacterium]